MEWVREEKQNKWKRESVRKGFTYSSCLIVWGEFKFEDTGLGAGRLELDLNMHRNVYRLLPFREGRACAKEKCTRWPFRRGLITSPTIRVVRTSPDWLRESEKYSP